MLNGKPFRRTVLPVFQLTLNCKTACCLSYIIFPQINGRDTSCIICYMNCLTVTPFYVPCICLILHCQTTNFWLFLNVRISERVFHSYSRKEKVFSTIIQLKIMVTKELITFKILVKFFIFYMYIQIIALCPMCTYDQHTKVTVHFEQAFYT
jgi:hypothetical protein